VDGLPYTQAERERKQPLGPSASTATWGRVESPCLAPDPAAFAFGTSRPKSRYACGALS
jgi:hypothetical protein